MSPLEIALEYIARGWTPIPVPHRAKRPTDNNWQLRRITADTAPRYFNSGAQNVGVQLGKESGGLVDVDLDTIEAVRVAPYFLQGTLCFGRASNPRSHWLYYSNLWIEENAAIQFVFSTGKGTDRTKRTILELRIGGGDLGAQTVFPGSTHESGEAVEWSGQEEITRADSADLKQRCRRAAAAALLAAYFPSKGARHDAGLTIGGFLCRCGLGRPDVEVFAEAVTIASGQGHEKVRDVKKAARDAWDEAKRPGGKGRGFTALAETFGEDVAKRVAEWLDYKGGREPSAAEEPPPIGEECDDARPCEKAPSPDAPITPIMRLLDELLSTHEPEPPMRNIMGQMAVVRVRKPRHASLHELAPDGAETRLEAPIMPLLTEHDETSLAILIERYVNFEKILTTKKGETRIPVSLAMSFVRHYHRYADSVLPTVHSVATMPLVLTNGKLAASQGLDRDLGIIFRIDPKLAALLPRPGSVTREDVKAAMEFLLDEWLVDVTPATVSTKCVLIVMAMTILERSVLVSGRPGFFITAAKRGGGKTTTAHMVSVAALGIHAVAAAWSPSEEERRKAMLSYLSDGLPFLCFDNIASGAAISSPTVEAMLTSGEISDRILGVSKTLHVAASTAVCFTGNNIAPCGDLSSRCLVARIDVDRPDPEHRAFRHPFPLDWTAAHRGKILAALYTIMLGDPEIGNPLSATNHTRFREWEMIIGRPVEHAAKLLEETVSFAELLTETEAEDETTTTNVEVLIALSRQWPGGKTFEARDVVDYFRFPSDAPSADIALVRDYFDPYAKGDTISAKKVGMGLKVLKDAPFLVDRGTIKLTGGGDDKHAKTRVYKIKRDYQGVA